MGCNAGTFDSPVTRFQGLHLPYVIHALSIVFRNQEIPSFKESHSSTGLGQKFNCKEAQYAEAKNCSHIECLSAVFVPAGSLWRWWRRQWQRKLRQPDSL